MKTRRGLGHSGGHDGTHGRAPALRPRSPHHAACSGGSRSALPLVTPGRRPSEPRVSLQLTSVQTPPHGEEPGASAPVAVAPWGAGREVDPTPWTPGRSCSAKSHRRSPPAHAWSRATRLLWDPSAPRLFSPLSLFKYKLALTHTFW